MIRFFLLLLLIKSTSLACALCINYSPETLVQIYIQSNKEQIKNAKIIWILNKGFTDSLKEVYDTNSDDSIDVKELILVEEAFLDYAKVNDFLTHISYDKVINKLVSNKIVVSHTKVYIKNFQLYFEYVIDLNYEIKKDYTLYIKVNDKKEFFRLRLDQGAIHFKNENKIQRLFRKQSVVFNINSAPLKEEEIQELTTTEVLIPTKEKTLLREFVKKVKKNLLSIKEEGNIFAFFALLFVSFIYGIVHAIGPGHGKTLAFSYFSSHKSSFIKAFIISQASAFIHILGAFVLVLISVFILQNFLNNFVADSVVILTKVSAIMIITLSCYMFYRKIKDKSCACSSCKVPNSDILKFRTQDNLYHQTQQKLKPISHIKKEYKQDLYFVLTAGLIPCPGTVVLFIYAFVLKTYFAVILASIFISFGMGLVIFLSAFVGVGLRKYSQKSQSFTTVIEYISIVIMFSLGLFLYLNANLI